MKKKVSVGGAGAPEPLPAASPPVPVVAGKPGQGWVRWVILSALLAGLLLGGLGARFWFKDQASHDYDAARQGLELILAESRAGLAQAHTQLDALQGQLMVEASTRKGLEASLQAAQAELGRARDQLAFFNQLLPPGPAGAVSIRALDIEQQGPILQYKVLLMRNGADDKPFKGLMQFVAKGSKDGKTVKMDLPAVTLPVGPVSPGGNAKANGFELSFDQFQRSSGFLSIPQGFTPQTITLNVLEGATVRVSRTVNLSAAD